MHPEDEEAWALEQRLQAEADPKAGLMNGPVFDEDGGDAVRDYEGPPLEWDGPPEPEPASGDDDDDTWTVGRARE